MILVWSGINANFSTTHSSNTASLNNSTLLIINTATQVNFSIGKNKNDKGHLCSEAKILSFRFSYIIILHYLQINISTLKCITSNEKKNVRSDQSSLSFRVGHCHKQLIAINMYITGIYRNKVLKVKGK